jgi:VanZ family protein
MAYGIFLEIFQGNFVPGRTADLYDTIANSLGVICIYLGHFFITD